MKEISIRDIPNITIGQVEDPSAGTGVTVFISPAGMAAGLDVRGGGPASRETELLKPLAAAQVIHAVVLGGGSAFGLDAAGGVMQKLEEEGIGFPVGVTRVPLVCQSDIFDLGVGDCHTRPDKAMGYQAAQIALTQGGNYQDGNFGGGCGATVGKWKGMRNAMKSGIGSYAVQVGELQVGAVVIVNAIGDIYDPSTGKKIAGLLNDEKNGFLNTEAQMYQKIDIPENKFTGNTTIGIIITNGRFDKTRLCKIAGMAHDGMARAIRPVHTTADGDSIYAVSVGEVAADQDITGTLAAEVLEKAIIRAIDSAESAYGLPSRRDLPKEMQ